MHDRHAGGGGGEDLLARLLRGAARTGNFVLSIVYEGLKAAGSLWVHPHPVDPVIETPPALAGPPAGHPERLCPHLPLSPEERDLWARLHADPEGRP
jgi:hypothetical protein